MTKHFLVLLLLLSPCFMYAQSGNQLKFNIETGAVASSNNQTPYWLVSNRYGLLKPASYNMYIKPGIFGNAKLAEKLNFSYGFEGVNTYGKRNHMYLNQGFGELKWGPFSLKGGAWEERFGNQDSILSTGGTLWSGNARPLPKISAFIPSFTNIPLTFGYAEIKGGISHGWFGKNQFSEKVWLHHKYAHMRFGGKLPVHLEVGMHHFVQWGGIVDDSLKLPKTLLDYYHLFWAYSATSSDESGEVNNRLGNHLGTGIAGINFTGEKFKLKAYWQTFFEDQSGLQFKNLSDGLWGFEIELNDKKSLIRGIVVEYMYTVYQSGPLFIQNTNGVSNFGRGNDNYFNNYLYRSGWTYKDMTIGNPLITSPVFMKGIEKDYIRNNKLEGIHLGIDGNIDKIYYRILYTSTENHGTYYFPFEKTKSQHSFLFETELQDVVCKDCDLGVSVGVDKGQLLGNHTGIELSFRKQINYSY